MHFVSHVAALLVAAAGAFWFNAILQRRLLKAQNKEKLIDALLRMMDEQCRFYADYWEKDAVAAPVSENQTAFQTRFVALLNVASGKYKIQNIGEIRRQYRDFCKLATGGDFGAKTRKADINISRRIHAAANRLYVALWENKI